MLIRFSTALIAALLVVPSAAVAGGPPIANTTANLNMRTGPGTNYPILTTIPHGGAVTIFNCTPGFGWCDAAFANTKGWVSARYLDYGGAVAPVAVPVIVEPVEEVVVEEVVVEGAESEGIFGWWRGPRYGYKPLEIAVPPYPYRPYDPGFPPRYFEQRIY